MAYFARTRKRVFPLLRAADGSAFEKCYNCGVSVAIALFDMHQCKTETKRNVKRLKGLDRPPKVLEVEPNVFEILDDEPKVLGSLEEDPKVLEMEPTYFWGLEECYSDQPRSAFRFFMEDFIKNCDTKNVFEIDRKGFETWKMMPPEEREPFITKEAELNLAYSLKMIKENADCTEKVDDEADSAESRSRKNKINSFGPFDSPIDGSENCSFCPFASFDSWQRKMVRDLGKAPSSFED